MIIKDKCSPAIIFIAFSLTQIIIDIFKNLYNTALIKFIVMIMFFIILNILCERGLTILSWFIVFLPFVMMTITTTLILFVFGLSPDEEKINYTIESDGKEDKTETTDPRAAKLDSNKKTKYCPKNVKDKDTIDITEKKTSVITDLNNNNNTQENTNSSTDRNWVLYSDKTYTYHDSEIQDDNNNSYDCMKRCNTNSDGTENKECKAFLINKSNGVTVNGSTDSSTSVTLSFPTPVKKGESVSGIGVEMGTTVASDSTGYNVTLSKSATIKNNTILTFGRDSCKLINNKISDISDKLTQHPNGGLIYKKTKYYNHISSKFSYPTGNAIKPIDFGIYSDLIQCKNLEGKTLCKDIECNDYIPTENYTCTTQTNEPTTESQQYNCERDSNNDCITETDTLENTNTNTNINTNTNTNSNKDVNNRVNDLLSRANYIINKHKQYI